MQSEDDVGIGIEIEEIKFEPQFETVEIEFIGVEAEDILKDRLKEEEDNFLECDEEYIDDESTKIEALEHIEEQSIEIKQESDQNIECDLDDNPISSSINDKSILDGTLDGYDDGNLKCKICSKLLSSKQSLRGHLRMHNGDYFHCSYCPRKFTRRNDLKYHENYHTGNHLLQCSYCPKKYSRKCLLRDHEFNVHGAGEHFKTITSKVSLEFDTPNLEDELSDSDEDLEPGQPILECHEELPTEHRLNNRLQHIERKAQLIYKCKICQLKFQNYISFEKHYATHTYKTVWKCRTCSKVFDKEFWLKKHRLTQHPTIKGEKPMIVQGAAQKVKSQVNPVQMAPSEPASVPIRRKLLKLIPAPKRIPIPNQYMVSSVLQKTRNFSN